jgi:hypothetical protein
MHDDHPVYFSTVTMTRIRHRSFLSPAQPGRCGLKLFARAASEGFVVRNAGSSERSGPIGTMKHVTCLGSEDR